MRAEQYPQKVFKLDTFLKKAVFKFEVDRRRVNPECVERIHRAYAVAMALPEIKTPTLPVAGPGAPALRGLGSITTRQGL